MCLAMDEPLYAEIWAPLNPPGDFGVQRQHMYVNLVVSHWEMEYGLHALTDEHLRVIARGVFSTDAGRRYWQAARPTRATSSMGRRERRFHQILDEEYSNAVATTKDTARPPRTSPPATPAAPP